MRLSKNNSKSFPYKEYVGWIVSVSISIAMLSFIWNMVTPSSDAINIANAMAETSVVLEKKSIAKDTKVQIYVSNELKLISMARTVKNPETSSTNTFYYLYDISTNKAIPVEGHNKYIHRKITKIKNIKPVSSGPETKTLKDIATRTKKGGR